jgi:hypothetical protein
MAEPIRAYAALSVAEIQQLAREHAQQGGHALQHPFTPGSTQAVAFERAFVARRIELDQAETA